MQNELRKKSKLLKAMQGITFAEQAELIEIKRNSFYSWLQGYYDLSAEKINRLNYIIDTLSEE